MAVSILVTLVLVVTGLGLVLRFVAIARRGRIFRRAKETLAWQLFHTDCLGAVFNFFFQVRLLKAGWVRWVIHLTMITGFVYLMFVHALDDWTSAWFDWYQPGIEPFRFLRNLAGLMVLAGALGFLVRRTLGLRVNLERERRGRVFRVRGTLTVVLIMGIILTGVLTESFQIMSPYRFEKMVEEYSDLAGDPDLAHLKAYWEKYYHVQFDRSAPKGSGTLAKDRRTEADFVLGEALNQDYCLQCHTRPDTAFLSAGLVRLAAAFGTWGGRWPLNRVFYWIHLSLVMLLLGCLPFSRMFHLLAIPLATARRRIPPHDLRTDMGYLDLVSLSACTHCGFCSEVCSVYPDYQISENPQVLPHIKLGTLKRLAGPGVVDPITLTRLRSGNDDCTRCGLCADICPSGIDLVRLWGVADRVLDRMGCPDNYTAVMDASFLQWTGSRLSKTGSGFEKEQKTFLEDDGFLPGLMKRSEAFEHCVQCTLCTNACPVVAHDLDRNDLGPHQIMNLLRLGEQQMASGSKMVWHCLTCYMCQEVCPQSIRVADIMLELRCRGREQAAGMTLSQLKGETV